MAESFDNLYLGETLPGFRSGQRVFRDRFELVRLIGRGGMGMVWLVKDTRLEREVALKFLPELLRHDDRAIADLKRETRRALSLTHNRIVRIFDFHEDAKLAGISMEYVDGQTLAQRCVEEPCRHLEVSALLPLVEQACDALAYAHEEEKIVHRDLKPGNLMVTADGRLKITDFGIAATLTETLSRTSIDASSSGTPVYMCPQQMMGEKARVSDDIYSLGATLYDLLTGKPPFYCGNILMQVQQKVPPSIAERRAELEVEGEPVPASWEATIAQCLAKEASERPADARTVLAQLKEESAAPGVATVPAALATSSPKAAAVTTEAPSRPRNWLTPVMILLLAGMLGAFGFWFAPSQLEGYEPRIAAALASLTAPQPERLAPSPDPEPPAVAEVEEPAASEVSDPDLAPVEPPAASEPVSPFEDMLEGPPAVVVNPPSRSEPEPVDNASPGVSFSQFLGPQEGETWSVPGPEIYMAWIAPGTFRMGSPSFEEGRDNDEDAHRVRLTAGFWMGKTEVTQGQWRRVMGTTLRDQVRRALQDDSRYRLGGRMQTLREYWNLSRFDDPTSRMGNEDDDLPMYYISWADAMEFCRRLTEQEQRAGRLPEGYVYTLPTEAQWEYACRAGTSSAIYTGRLRIFGENFGPELDFIAWYGGNSSVGYEGRGWDTGRFREKQFPGGVAGPRTVGQKRPNAWDLYDMLGNVWEWCFDYYGAYPDQAVTDPLGPTVGDQRVVRGGGWVDKARFCRSAFRGQSPAEARDYHIGFRVVLAQDPGIVE